MNSALLQQHEAAIRHVGLTEGLEVVGHSPAFVRRLLCGDRWATKRRVAALLVGRFPELAGCRTTTDALRERYWAHMFDAVAVAAVSTDERGAATEATA